MHPQAIPVEWSVVPLNPKLHELHKVFKKWLGDTVDVQLVNTVLAAMAGNRMKREPIWLMVIATSGAGKTLLLNSLTGLKHPDVHDISTIHSEGALLSAGKPRDKKDEAAASGGILREIDRHGVMVIKDFTTILSMSDRGNRPMVLAALREIHDGKWVRSVGVEGGRKIRWEGHVGIIAACTQVWDDHHAAIAAMGDRFIVIRMQSASDEEAALKAVENSDKKPQANIMNFELREAVNALLQPIGVSIRSKPLPEIVKITLGRAITIAMRARTPVKRDPRGYVCGDIPDPESPNRMMNELCELIQGALAIGIELEDAFDIAMRCVRDSIPRTRMACIKYLVEHESFTAKEMSDRLEMNWGTVNRSLQDLVEAKLIRAEKHKEGGRNMSIYHQRAGIDLNLMWSRINLAPPAEAIN